MNDIDIEYITRVLLDSLEHVQSGREIPSDYARILFPSQRKESELTYYGKDTEGSIIANTIAVPFQKERAFGKQTLDKEWTNKLIFGENLQILKSLVDMKRNGQLINNDGTEGIRLIYIDPPFSTKKDFRPSGEDQKAYQDKLDGARFIEWLRKRLILLKELLSDDGTIYVHLDYRKVHYIKIIMDEIFGENKFRNEIIWHYGTYVGQTSKYFPRKHDSILVYSKTLNPKFFPQNDDNPSNDANFKRWSKYFNQKNQIVGKHYPKDDTKFSGYVKRFEAINGRSPKGNDVILEVNGKLVDSVWEIQSVNPMSKEKNGYPTQKPEELLERIIKSSSEEGDIVLDCFAGSGTTPAVAEKLNRKWIACDVGKYSIYTIQKRLLTLKEDIGNKGKILTVSPFTLYSAGLYDPNKLLEFSDSEWKKFALMLWNCVPKVDNSNKFGGFQFDGLKGGYPVKVYTPKELDKLGAKISLDTIEDIHSRVKKSIPKEVYIIAPKGKFSFAQDVIEIDDIAYNFLRIPYSYMSNFTENFIALTQPSEIESINEGVDAIGFDFINYPSVDWEISDGCLIIKNFISKTSIKDHEMSVGLDKLSMILIDYNYDGDTFYLDEIIYAKQLENGCVTLNHKKIGKKMMIIFIDKYGNELKVVYDE